MFKSCWSLYGLGWQLLVFVRWKECSPCNPAVCLSLCGTSLVLFGSRLLGCSLDRILLYRCLPVAWGQPRQRCGVSWSVVRCLPGSPGQQKGLLSSFGTCYCTAKQVSAESKRSHKQQLLPPVIHYEPRAAGSHSCSFQLGTGIH